MNPATPLPSGPPIGQGELDDAIDRFARASVLVLGDAMLDRYIHGTIRGASPEAPVPVLTVQREIALPGGAGNVVRNLTALGTAAAFVSVVGDDQAGSDLTGLIGGQPNVEPWLLVQGGRTTTRKSRFLCEGKQMMRADREDTTPLDEKLSGRLLRIALDAMAATSVTLLSDYGKGVLNGTVAPAIIAAARAAGRKVAVAPNGTDYSRYAGADLITPNPEELAAATGLDTRSEAALVAAAQHLRQAHDIGAVVVTRAAQGMTLVDAAGVQHLPGEPAELLDPAGAGDTVIATLAAALAGGTSLPVAVRLANLAASLVIARPGIAVAPADELRRIVRSRQ